jgi:hypothetical protein
MGAAAPARRAPARAPARPAPARGPATRRAPKRAGAAAARRPRAKAAPARRRTHPITPPGGHLIPLAVGRTAVAVRGLPDSGLVMRMTSGRAWIGVLSVLLAGIVALNVVSLSIGASSSKIAQETQALQQENSALRARLAVRLSNSRILQTASSLGMVNPDGRDVSYRTASPDQARLAAARLGDGFGAGSTSYASTTAAPATTTTSVAAPTTTAAPTSTTTTTASTAPAPTPTATQPAPTATAAAPAPAATVAPSTGSAGGVATG